MGGLRLWLEAVGSLDTDPAAMTSNSALNVLSWYPE